jgi:hypothetical protein
MELLVLLQELAAKLADAQAALDLEKKKSYDEGFAAGVASVLPGTDKVYSQEELNAAVLAAKEGLQLEIDSLKAELEVAKADLEKLKADLDVKVEEAKAALKVELLAKLDAQQAAESESEAALRAEIAQ